MNLMFSCLHVYVPSNAHASSLFSNYKKKKKIFLPAINQFNPDFWIAMETLILRYFSSDNLIQPLCYILIAEQLAGVHWWYKTTSHAAELMAGFYNPCNRDGYAAVMAMLKKHGAALNFTCAELHMLNRHEDFPEAMADPEGLAWQVSIKQITKLSLRNTCPKQNLFISPLANLESLCKITL